MKILDFSRVVLTGPKDGSIRPFALSTGNIQLSKNVHVWNLGGSNTLGQPFARWVVAGNESVCTRSFCRLIVADSVQGEAESGDGGGNDVGHGFDGLDASGNLSS
jgi:hypothetical protein